MEGRQARDCGEVVPREDVRTQLSGEGFRCCSGTF